MSSSSSSSSADSQESSSSADAQEAKILRLDIRGTHDYAARSSSSSGTKTNDLDSFSNACLDLFLLDAYAPPQRLRDLLAAAWDQDALTALKLVCRRRTVKRDTEGFFAAATWMLQIHPRVFVDNLPAFAELGYFQDFVVLLERLSSSAEAAPEEEATHVNLQPQPAPAGLKRAFDDDDDDDTAHHAPATAITTSPVPVPKRARHDDPGTSASAGATALPSSALAVADPAPIGSEAAATTTYNIDLPYHTLYKAITDFFVDRLASDLGHLNNGNMSMISLAARWCPIMGSPSDQTTLLRMDIARRLVPGTGTDTDTDRDLHLRHSVIDRLVSALDKQKQQAPESRRKIRPKLPHLIASKMGREGWEKKTAEEQDDIIKEWLAMVADLRAKESMRNCIAICDVSEKGLMKQGDSTLFKVCVALGLLVAELSEEPWKNWVHAFSHGAGHHFLGSKTGHPDKVEAIRKLKCSGRFNRRKVLEWVLEVALLSNVQPANMVRTIMVYTSKDFEQALVPPKYIVRAEDLRPKDFNPDDVRQWSDDYRIVCDKFKDKGYEDCVPGIVFWNLSGERSAALTSSTEHDGVLSLSGYSAELLRLFLEKGGVVHADDEMTAAIAGKEYEKLEVKEY